MSNKTHTDEAYQCWNCGNSTAMRVAANARVDGEIEMRDGPPLGSGTLYDVLECPTCSAKALRSAGCNDYMEHEGELNWRLIYPDAGAYDAIRRSRQVDADRRFMELAVAEAAKSKSEPSRVSPKVGAVVARGLELVGAAFRGELREGDHAEYTLLEGKCPEAQLAGTTVYTTLEPCTERGHPKVPCLERLRQRHVRRVVVGMLDPNETIRGRGVLGLRHAGIAVDLFPFDLMSQLEEMNRAFISDQQERMMQTARGTERCRADRAGILSFFHDVHKRLPRGLPKDVPTPDDDRPLLPLVREVVTGLADRRDELQQKLGGSTRPGNTPRDGAGPERAG